MARARSTEPGTTDLHAPVPILALGALGVVFGDIGTSPLYAYQQCFSTGHGFSASPAHVLGILSLITWALIMVVCVKYASVVLRADYNGEGGTLALLAQLRPTSRTGIPGRVTKIALLLLFGSAMLYGDGMITPAISVLSAVEGLGVWTSRAVAFEVPITVVVLIALFVFQSRGTGRIGNIFGPIMLLWFAALAAGGIAALVHAPAVLAAANPLYALRFIADNRIEGILVLGAVVLCVTGVEALYADLAHFGRRPIWLAWYSCVFPALLLNYYGQAAITLFHPTSIANPFYALYPGWTLIPMVVLSTAATIIASQALISGAFSLTQQAVQLGYLPRLRIVHTSDSVEGQIFLPFVNIVLAIGCIAIVLAFKNSTALGSAYGLAVTVTMMTTSIAIGALLTRRFKWNPLYAYPLVALFILIDGAFFLGNITKLADGAWLPAAVAIVIFTLFLTWLSGRRRLATELKQHSTPIDQLQRSIPDAGGRRDGTAIFLTPIADTVPFAMGHHWLRSRLAREEIVLLTISSAREPYVDPDHRVTVDRCGVGMTRIVASYGFMETPQVAEILAAARPHVAPEVDLDDADYLLARPRLTHTRGSRNALAAWRRWLLGYMMRNASPLTDSLGIPADRIVEFSVPLAV